MPFFRFCDRCLALQGTNCPPHLDYRNIGPSEAWSLTRIDDRTHRNLDSGSLSPWSKVEGFNFLQISFDFMHHVYLGTARDLCASGASDFTTRFILRGSRHLVSR